MKNSIILFLLFIPTIIFAQKNNILQHIDENAKKYAATITQEELKKHLFVIAADSMEGRKTGKRGQKKAAKYIENHFKKIGMQKSVRGNNGMSYLQEFQSYKTEWKDVYGIDKEGKKYKWLKDIFAIYASEKMREEKEMQAIWLSSDYINSNYFDTLRIDNNEQAFFIRRYEKQEDNDKIYDRLLKKRIKTIFFVCVSKKDFNDELELKNIYLKMPQNVLGDKRPKGTMNVFFVTPKAAEGLTGEKNILSKEKYFKGQKFKVKAERWEIVNWTSENVLGFLQGTDKQEEIIIIGAHYDHIGANSNYTGTNKEIDRESIYNGADDNGSGTVALLELAEAFSKAARDGFKPRRSILFIAFSGEELGLFGSKFYTDFQPIFPLDKTIVNLNMDMIGRIGTNNNSPNTVCLVGSNRLSTELHQINEEANKQMTQLKLDYSYDSAAHPERIFYRSDHYNFAKNNIPVIFYNDGTHEDYHQSTDKADKINYPNLEKITKLVFYTAWELANREQKIKIDKIDKSSKDDE